MPVEIRELIIKAYVEPTSQNRIGTTSSDQEGEDNEVGPIAENLDQFIELLNNKNER